MLLVIDIGNTNIVLALNNNNNWLDRFRVKTNSDCVENEISQYLKNCKIDGCVLSSVVPDLTPVVKNIIEKMFSVDVFVVNNKIITGLDNTTIPDEIGSDILCNLIAGHYFNPNKLVTVADFGTAFTTETVSSDGKILGVTIGPGLMTSVKALFSNTAQIPTIRLDLPETVLGRDTESSVRAGVVYGFTGQLNAIVDEIEKELNQKTVLIITGGFSYYVGPYVHREHVADIDLTIEGAKLAWIFNH